MAAILIKGLLPGKPVAYNYGLLWLLYGLLWGIVAYYFGLLGFPGRLVKRGLTMDHIEKMRWHGIPRRSDW